LNCSEYFWGKV